MNMKHGMRRRALALTVALAAFGGSVALANAPDPDRVSLSVRYSDLNLTREEGARTLYSRLQSAARRVCGVGQDRDLVWQALALSCAEKALGDAVAELDNPQVSALHDAHDHRRPAPVIVATGRRIASDRDKSEPSQGDGHGHG